VILSNNVMLAGHCTVGNFVIIGGGAGVHPVRAHRPARLRGRHVGAIENDVIPYGMALGNRAHLAGLNIIGLRRRGFTREQIHDMRRAYRLLFADEGTLVRAGRGRGGGVRRTPDVHEILDFIREGKDRAICTPRELRVAADDEAPGSGRRDGWIGSAPGPTR
jgi:UDP-N-acetylglucosamine acyltransferase